MKQFKQLNLVFTSLLVVAFSFSFTKSFDLSTSFQKKTLECHLSSVADDDIDDDLTDPEFQFIYTGYQEPIAQKQDLIIDLQYTSASRHSSLPCYLKIRNLRI